MQQQKLRDEYVPGERAGSRRQDQKTNDEKRAGSAFSCSFEVVEMKRNKSSRKCSIALALVNVLALIYPINLLLRAKSVDENLFATFLLIASVFLLALLDAISIVAVDAAGTSKHRYAAEESAGSEVSSG